MRKNSGPNVDPWGNPALTGNQSDVWPLSKIRWNLLFKKLFMSFNKSPENLTDFN